jgi:hypothetical protein
MIETNIADKPKLGRPLGEMRDCHVIAESIQRPS